ncbi:MAG: M14 family zinc carboxypeptidase [Phycisphaerales bacterium]
MRPNWFIPVSAMGAMIFVGWACSPVERVADIPPPWEAQEPQTHEPVALAPEALPRAWERIGSSVRGKAIQAMTVGNGTRRVYVIGSIHGDEPEAREAAALLPEALEAQKWLAGATIRVIRDMNPDGSATGARTNTRGVDLDRNWPTKDFFARDKNGRRASSELETATVHKDMLAFKPDVVVVLGSSVVGPVVRFQGPVRRWALEFASAARRVDPKWRFQPDPSEPVPGSLESLAGRDMGKAVLAIELGRERDAMTNAKALAEGLHGLTEAAAKTAATTKPGATAKPAKAAAKPPGAKGAAK